MKRRMITRRAWMAAATMAALAGLCRGETPAAGSFRFLTFNIFGAGYSGFKAEEREDRAIDVVRGIAPDIISWQEVNAGWWNSKLFKALAEEFTIVRGDEDEALVRAGADLSQRKANWVNHEPLMFRTARFAMLDHGLDFYHISLQFEKSLTWAVLEDKTSGKRLIAFATHFWWQHNGKESDAIRELNVRHILWRLADVRRKWGDLPVVGGGDLNCAADSMPLKTFRQNGFVNVREILAPELKTPTWHGHVFRDAQGKCRGLDGDPAKKHRTIDHIFFTNGRFTPLAYAVETRPEARDISDHYPVYADLAL